MRKDYFALLREISVSSLVMFLLLRGCRSTNWGFRTTNGSCSIKFVNTSMHGVGHTFVTQAFQEYNFPPFVPVSEQQEPDPDFPTVKFPNPEEKGMY